MGLRAVSKGSSVTYGLKYDGEDPERIANATLSGLRESCLVGH